MKPEEILLVDKENRKEFLDKERGKQINLWIFLFQSLKYFEDLKAALI